MLKSFFLATTLILSACTYQSEQIEEVEQPLVIATQTAAKDGYVFEISQFVSRASNINIVRHNSYEDMRAAYKGDLPEDKKLLGFAHYKTNNDKSKCTIHIIDPRIEYRPEVIGHELTHCIHGDFHPERSKELRLSHGNDSSTETQWAMVQRIDVQE